MHDIVITKEQVAASGSIVKYRCMVFWLKKSHKIIAYMDQL